MQSVVYFFFVLWLTSFILFHAVPFVHYQVKLNVALCGTTAQVGSRDIFTRESGMNN